MNAIGKAAPLLARRPAAAALTMELSQMPQNHQQKTTRCMSKYLSKAAAKRVPLNTKRAGKGYVKGKGGTKEGKLNSKGQFIVDPTKRLELVVPDLENFKVRYASDDELETSPLASSHADLFSIRQPTAQTVHRGDRAQIRTGNEKGPGRGPSLRELLGRSGMTTTV